MTRWRFFLLSTVGVVIIVLIVMANYTAVYGHPPPSPSPMRPITPVPDTPHLMVSAFMDDRVAGWDVRIIAILRKDAMQKPLHCVFRGCGGHSSDHGSTPAGFQRDSMGFGFPFEVKFVMCRIPTTCVRPTDVTLSVHPGGGEERRRQESFLPIGNRKTGATEEEEATAPQVDFTVCLSTLFGGYNNVLQYTQALEMYRLLGVDRVVVYNTSCGPDLDRLLRSYSQEGFVEVVPWPIDKHLTPSRGWKYLQHGPGDLHYFGQMATLHDCMYRNMESSRYVLLHDIDEIILPYQHDNLSALMSQLQKQHPKAGVFQFQMDLFPTEWVRGASRPPQWEGVPGINILEHIDRLNAPEAEMKWGNCKMIVQPRMVEETSVHNVVKHLGNNVVVPPDMARIIHVRSCMFTNTNPPTYNPECKGRPHIDTRLWHFGEKLIASVDKALGRIGMLKTKALRA